MAGLIVVNSAEQWRSILDGAKNDGKAVIVDFTATWCGPCRMIGPFFAEYATKFPTIIFLKVDVDELQTVAEECKITAMPTFQVFKGGVKVDELVGASKEKLETMIKKYV